MKRTKIFSILGIAVSALALQPLAVADWVTVPNSGSPVISCNPKDTSGNQDPSQTLCKVAGLPPAILTNYILAAKTTTTTGSTTTEGTALTINSTVVGTRYDRVYCKSGTGASGCDYSSPVIIATRVQMSSAVTDSAKNTHCPVWSGTTNECFEVNDFYRLIRGTNPTSSGGSATEISTDVGYFMGTVSGGTDPDTALALKYVEFAGKTGHGIWKPTSAAASAAGIYAPGSAVYTNITSSGDRDATHIMFQADTNVYDPDGLSSQWSPWLFVRQSCPNGFNVPTTGTFSNRFYEGSEEGQLAQSISASGYSCKP